MSRFAKALLFGFAVALAGLLLSATPLGLALEENLGLGGLFSARGEREPPPQVVVVSLDKPSADQLGLPNEPDKWPRTLHARLVENLARFGAAVIAFDIIFDEEDEPAHDASFAAAVRRAGNVVLFEYLKKETQPLLDQLGKVHGNLVVERLIPPLPILAEAAAATAPFPLPKVPIKVNQFWLFKAGAGDRATLSVVAFQLYALSAYDELLRLLQRVHPTEAGRLPHRNQIVHGNNVHELIQRLRTLLNSEPEIYTRLLAELGAGDQNRLLRALANLYREHNQSRYLNFYGPPRRIQTLSYYQVLNARHARDLPVDLRGAAVFVGVAESTQPEQRDAFYTAFSQNDGMDISGVEIAATGFANLLDDSYVRPLSPLAQLGLVSAWGLLIGFVCLWWRVLPGIAILTGLCVLYIALAYSRFASGAHWHPLVVPLLVQVPFALFGALLWHYLDTNRERRHIRQAFGFYLPETVVDTLAKNLSNVQLDKQMVYGVCLASDAEKYTTLAESVDPEVLSELMNRYYAAVFGPVRKHGGFVSDVVGDSMLAIWAGAGAEHALRSQACQAALEIVQAVEDFNATIAPHKLGTRLGLHAGPIMLGNVGAIDHYEYRAVGDIVNTASRLESLNKILGTRILVATESLEGLNQFLTRNLGSFVLPGKSKPVAVSELVCLMEKADARLKQRCVEFSAALENYTTRNWQAACEAFMRLLDEDPSDKAARFYVDTCKHYLATPPAETWAPPIRIGSY